MKRYYRNSFVSVIISSFHVQPWCATKLKDEVTDWGNVASWAYCGPDCPIETNSWKTDDNLKVTHHRDMDQKQKMMSVRLIGIMSSSLILLALMMRGLGISGSEI